MWKCGFPETFTYLIGAYEAGLFPLTASKLSRFLNGIGLILHHSSTSLVVCGVATHLWPLSRPLLAPCMLPVVQHWFALLKYEAFYLYTFIELALEVVFYVEVCLCVCARARMPPAALLHAPFLPLSPSPLHEPESNLLTPITALSPMCA